MDNTASTTRKYACAGCKIKRQKCSEKCVLAPFFPENDLQKFLSVKTVFGNAYVSKLLQDLPDENRDDAVKSMVYEANNRLRDRVHGSLGVINGLEKEVAELQSQLGSTKKKIEELKYQLASTEQKLGDFSSSTEKKVEELKSQLTSTEQKLGDFSSSTEKKVEELKSQLASIEQKLEDFSFSREKK